MIYLSQFLIVYLALWVISGAGWFVWRVLGLEAWFELLPHRTRMSLYTQFLERVRNHLVQHANLEGEV